jgi:hypothetical protein
MISFCENEPSSHFEPYVLCDPHNLNFLRRPNPHKLLDARDTSWNHEEEKARSVTRGQLVLVLVHQNTHNQIK